MFCNGIPVSWSFSRFERSFGFSQRCRCLRIDLDFLTNIHAETVGHCMFSALPDSLARNTVCQHLHFFSAGSTSFSPNPIHIHVFGLEGSLHFISIQVEGFFIFPCLTLPFFMQLFMQLVLAVFPIIHLFKFCLVLVFGWDSVSHSKNPQGYLTTRAFRGGGQCIAQPRSTHSVCHFFASSPYHGIHPR